MIVNLISLFFGDYQKNINLTNTSFEMYLVFQQMWYHLNCIGCLNIDGTYVTAYNSTNNNAVFF